MKQLHILLVEDDPAYLLEVEVFLQKLPEFTYTTASSAAEARQLLQRQIFDLALLDINIKGKETGVDIGRFLRLHYPRVAVVFMTAFAEGNIYEDAKSISPYAFLVKPFDELTLRSTIDAIAQQQSSNDLLEYERFEKMQEGHMLREHLFVKANNRLHKVRLPDISFIEADGNYSIIYAQGRKYIVKISLKQFLTKLSSLLFIRIHRNYVVQIPFLDSIDFSSNELVVAGQNLPIGAKYKTTLSKRLNRIS